MKYHDLVLTMDFGMLSHDNLYSYILNHNCFWYLFSDLIHFHLVKRTNGSWAYNFDTLSTKFGQWNKLVAPQSYCDHATGDKMITIIFFVLSKRTNWCLFYLRWRHEYPFNIARTVWATFTRKLLHEWS